MRYGKQRTNGSRQPLHVAANSKKYGPIIPCKKPAGPKPHPFAIQTQESQS